MLSEQLVQGGEFSIQIRADKTLEVHPFALDMSQLSMVFHSKQGEVAQLAIELVDISAFMPLLRREVTGLR